MSKNITRRNLLKGVAMAGAVSAANAVPAFADGTGFDDEYDVVVVGMGGAGMNAAIAAYEEGAKVLIVEKAPEGAVSGNTRFAGQNVLSTDDPEAFHKYLIGLMGEYKNWDPDCLEAYAYGAAENWDWFVNTLGMDPDVACPTDEAAIGTPRHPTWIWKDDAWHMGRGGWVPMWNEFPEIEGNEASLNILVTTTEFDSSYFNLLKDAVAAREGENLTVWYGAPAKKFILDENGAVAGVIIEKDGELMSIGAKGGVCMCCGGFESNQKMVASFCQLPYMYPRAGLYNEGDGINMCQAIGAQLWHLSNLSGLGYGYHLPGTNASVSTSAGRRGIYVGPCGGRFVNEAASSRHGRIQMGGGWNIPPMPMPAFAVVDADHIADPMVSGFSEGNADEIADGTIYSGETLEELAEKIRERAPKFDLNGEFADAVAKYNAHCEAGDVDDFGRECTEAVKTPPFYAIEICPALSFNTQGGPRHSAKGEILDTQAMPIPGLFAGGEFGSIFPDMYNGGGNLGETCIFGRIAGRNAGLRAKGEFEPTTEPCKLQFELEQE